MQKKYYINTYGCQMNVHESEKIAGMLLEHNYVAANNIEEADLIVYNTCCIRETAEKRIYGHLSKAKKMKKERPDLKIILCGCMAQKPGELPKLKARLPYVDLIIGTHNLYKLGEYLDKIQDENKYYEVWEKELPGLTAPVVRNNKISAFIDIMQGCNNFCSYCIVPYVKGRERSRDSESIIAEAQDLLSKGFKEITLLGQNVNSYKCPKTNMNFAGLLESLNNLDGKFKIRFMTSHPKDLSDEVIKTIANGKNLAKYIHLPVQSGNNRILKLMNRTYTREQYLERINKIREYMPDAGISSDLMVGFPSETEEEFLDSLRLIEEVKFNNLYTFIYNRRSGTKADLMEDQIPEEVKVDRIERIIKRQQEIANEEAKKSIGNVYKVLCEKVENGIGYGKSFEDRPVYFKADEDNIGQFIMVKVSKTKNTKLYGDIVNL